MNSSSNSSDWFPLRAFLNQPVFSRKSKLVLNPARFWQLYRVQYLERCWHKDSEHQGRQRS